MKVIIYGPVIFWAKNHYAIRRKSEAKHVSKQ